MRRLDLVQAADVDEDGTPVDPVKTSRDLRKAVNRQRSVILSKVQCNHVLITAGAEFDHSPKGMELVAKLRLPGNEDLLSVLDLQVALAREMHGSLDAQRTVRRAMPDQTVTEANARTYGTMLDAIYLQYHDDHKPPVLGENAVARPGNLIVPARKKPTPRVHYEAAMKAAQAWPREEETIRKEYAEAGLAISPLKRARDSDEEGGQPKRRDKGKGPAADVPQRAAHAAGTAVKKETNSDDDLF